jgi:predicted secreted Zn-dependent protease
MMQGTHTTAAPATNGAAAARSGTAPGWRRAAGGALLLAALGIATVQAAPDAGLTIEYYDVQGTTLEQLRESLRTLGPVDDDGERHHGQVRWNLQWRYNYSTDRGGCRLTGFTVQRSTTMQLPRWVDVDRVSPALRSDWERYSRALRLHEDGHVETGALAAAEIERRTAAVKRSPTCAALTATLDEIGKAVIQEFKARDVEYDATTGHGATQDAQI